MIAGMFKDLAGASLGTRLPNPALGTADYLVESIKMRENRGGGSRVNVNCRCLRSVDGEQEKGDQISYVLFSGDFFLKELKRLILCLADVPATEEAAIVDMMCPIVDKDGKPTEYAELDDLERSTLAWETIAAATCAMDEKGQPLASGDFDGQVVIRLETIVKAAKPTGKFVQVDGQMVAEVGKDFVNTYPLKVIPLPEVAEFLDEKDITRFFGSAENFAALLDD